MSSTAMLTSPTSKEDAATSVSCHHLTMKIKTQARWPPSDKTKNETALHRPEEVVEVTKEVTSNARARRTRRTRLTRRKGSSRSSRPRLRSTTRSMPRSACFQVCRLQLEIRLQSGKRRVCPNSQTTKKVSAKVQNYKSKNSYSRVSRYHLKMKQCKQIPSKNEIVQTNTI